MTISSCRVHFFPNNDGFQPTSDGNQPKSDGLHQEGRKGWKQACWKLLGGSSDYMCSRKLRATGVREPNTSKIAVKEID